MALATLLFPQESASSGFGAYGVATSAFGAIASAIGSMYSAKSAKNNLKFQSEMAALNAQHAKFVGDTNARIGEIGAESVLVQGQQQIGVLTLKSGKLKSSQRATMAANGIDLGEGNAAEVLASTDIMTEIDKNTLEANAVRSAWGYRMQGVNAKVAGDQQALNYSTASNFNSVTSDAINPGMSGASSLISGAGNVASAWYKYSGGEYRAARSIV